MKKKLFFAALFIFTACGVKQNKNLLSQGNYDEVITNCISNLRTNKDSKGNGDYVYLLEEAFAKAKERDLNTINFFEKENNQSNFEKVYNTYILLNERQEKIKPLLPLKLIKEGRSANFIFENYNNEIIASKNKLSSYLHSNSIALLSTTNKLNFRKAYDDLIYLNQINPNFKNVANLINDALAKGTDYVFVNTVNETNLVIPNRLQNDLLDFSANGLNKKWTIFHGNKQKGINYDYSMQIGFREILISPEQIKEREFIKERQIKDGQKKLLDANGKEVLDNKGKVVMVDNMRNVTVQIYEFKQNKSCQIQAKVDYLEHKTNQLVQSFPIASEFVFENIYSNYKGDRRAAEDNYISYFDNRAMPFPTSEQMIYDTGENLKIKIKNIINQNNFRR